jgi:hypothetical protein
MTATSAVRVDRDAGLSRAVHPDKKPRGDNWVGAQLDKLNRKWVCATWDRYLFATLCPYEKMLLIGLEIVRVPLRRPDDSNRSDYGST